MKYVVIGAGGTGGILGTQLAKGGKDVTLIARGAHLAAIEERGGLFVDRVWNGTSETIAVKACTMDDYHDTPDVVLVCVKGYSIEGVVPFIERVAGPDTVVLPILNIYGTGGKLQAMLPKVDVLEAAPISTLKSKNQASSCKAVLTAALFSVHATTTLMCLLISR